jgi:hypothetical protein
MDRARWDLLPEALGGLTQDVKLEPFTASRHSRLGRTTAEGSSCLLRELSERFTTACEYNKPG